jgi:hypothetical protein
LCLVCQAEEWGFAGSRRFVQDLSSFQCTHAVSPASAARDGAGACLSPTRPSLAFADFSLTSIDHVIAVDQVDILCTLCMAFPAFHCIKDGRMMMTQALLEQGARRS